MQTKEEVSPADDDNAFMRGQWKKSAWPIFFGWQLVPTCCGLLWNVVLQESGEMA